MTEPIRFDPPPPEYLDCDGHVWCRLYPRPGQVAVPLSSEHLTALAEYEHRKGSRRAQFYDFMRHEAETGESQRVTPRIRVVAHGADDGFDRLGRRWLLVTTTAGTAMTAVTCG